MQEQPRGLMNNQIIKDLESMLDSLLRDTSLPYSKGNSIRIKNYVIRKNKSQDYIIVDLEKNQTLTKTHFKNCAIAMVKNLIEGKNEIRSIARLDQDLLKHYNDAIFFKKIIQNTKDEKSREIREIRLDESIKKTNYIKSQIDNIIFNN